MEYQDIINQLKTKLDAGVITYIQQKTFLMDILLNPFENDKDFEQIHLQNILQVLEIKEEYEMCADIQKILETY